MRFGDHVFFVVRRNPATKLNISETERAWYEIEWFPVYRIK